MKRIVVGISGASGSPLALRFLEALHACEDVEIHLVVSDSALLTASYELEETITTSKNEAAKTRTESLAEGTKGCGSHTSELPILKFDNPFKRFAHVYYENTAFDAAISSGSFPIDAMVVIPCSMKTVAGIASGYADNLLLRGADVTIKEKRPLILVARESPLSPIHLKNLAYLSTLPSISIVPPLLTYYGGQTTVQDMEDHVIGKIFSLLDLNYAPFRRWSTEGDQPME